MTTNNDMMDWAETETTSFEKVSLPSGKYFSRIRSVIHLGMVHFSFNKIKNAKADAALGLVFETWQIELDEETEEYVLKSETPAITYDVLKLSSSDKGNWKKIKTALGISGPQELAGRPVELEIYTSDKGNMYPKASKMTKLGLAERKAVPPLTKDGLLIPSLAKMTREGIEELNAFTQVKDYILEATNYEGSAAEEVIEEIRLEKPDFAVNTKEAKPTPEATPVTPLSEEEEY